MALEAAKNKGCSRSPNPFNKGSFLNVVQWQDEARRTLRSGLDDRWTRAKADGKRVSRPRIPEEKRELIERLARESRSIRAIARAAGVSVGTVANYVSDRSGSGKC